MRVCEKITLNIGRSSTFATRHGGGDACIEYLEVFRLAKRSSNKSNACRDRLFSTEVVFPRHFSWICTEECICARTFGSAASFRWLAHPLLLKRRARCKVVHQVAKSSISIKFCPCIQHHFLVWLCLPPSHRAIEEAVTQGVP